LDNKEWDADLLGRRGWWACSEHAKNQHQQTTTDTRHAPKRPGRAAGVMGRGEIGPGAGAGAGGRMAGLGRHCAQAGTFGFGASIAGTDVGTGAGAGRLLGALSLRVDLCTTFHAGRAWMGGPSSIGGGVVATGGGAGGSWDGGVQLGEYSPPAPCFDLTAINSAISN
jgi:hypothetical protein